MAILTLVLDNARKAERAAAIPAPTRYQPPPPRDYNAEITDPALRAENERNLKTLAERSGQEESTEKSDDSGPTDEVLEHAIARNISDRVSESPEQMLKICDDMVRYVNRLPNLKKMARMDCLIKANEMMALSDEEPISSQKFKKDRNGKYRFKDAVGAVKTVAIAASKL